MILKYLVVFKIISVVCGDFTNFDSLYPQIEQLIENSQLYQAPVNNSEYWSTTESVIDENVNFGTFDFIIVGGGAAGGVLANRLTEEKFNVLVIEAGGKTPDTSAVLGVSTLLYNSKYNWGFNTTSQKNACFGSPQNQCNFPRGKTLGGSSAINAGIYCRGNAEDFNKWEKLGNPGWSYNEVLPYFKKSEYANFTQNIDKNYHGFSGLQSIGVGEDTAPIFTQMILDGFSELGYKEVDYNGENQIGYSRLQFYKTYNVRSSTNYSFIRPIFDRSNLHISLDSLVTKIRITKNTAKGVEFIKNGQKYYANATKEVILSAGAVGSTQLLMLSGIGPRKHLKELGIDVIANLPVGKYFQDHVMFNFAFTIEQPYKAYTTEEATKLWLNDSRPWNVGYNGEIVNFFSFENSSIPDMELLVPGLSSTTGNISTGNIFMSLINPLSIGEITLASKNPNDFPLINPNYLANESDVESLYKGIQKGLELLNTTSCQKYHANVTVPSIEECDEKNVILSKDWWICQLRYTAISIFHPSGSTRMGNCSKTSVVNSELKVHGVQKLRVVDAGIIPTPPRGHTNAPTVMLAEKIADVIKKNYS